jgi:hypothetical protein
MSATGEASLFDSDGTQAPQPQDSFADPLSGLVTGGGATPSVAEEYERVRIADPVQPDPDTVREMVNAAMLAESADYDRAIQPAAIPPQMAGSSVVPEQPPLGIIPQQKTWPARPPQLLRQARRPKQRVAAKNLKEPQEALKRSQKRIRRGKPSSSAGVVIAIVLMIVFAILVIQLLVSLFSSIAGIFA